MIHGPDGMGFIMGLLLVLPGGCLAARGGEGTTPTGDPLTPAQLVQRIATHLEELSGLALTVRAQSEQHSGLLGLGGSEATADLLLEVLMGRGGRFRLNAFQDGKPVAAVVCDGALRAEWDGRRNEWTQYPPYSSTEGSTPLLLIRDRAGTTPFVHLTARCAESWVGPDSPYVAWLTGLVQEGQLHAAPEEIFRGRRCHVLKGKKSMAESGKSVTMKFTLAFDQETYLPADEEQIIKGTLLLVPAFGLHDHFVFERVEVTPALEGDTFRFEPPAGSTFVDSKELRPARSTLVGQPAPAACFRTLDGQKILLAELHRDKPVVLVFWATWCMPCKFELKDLSENLRSGASEDQPAIVAVSTDRSVETVRAFLGTHPLLVTVLHDPDDRATKLFDVQGFPQTFVIDRSGVILNAWTGWSPGGDSSTAKARLEEIRATLRKEVPASTSPPSN